MYSNEILVKAYKSGAAISPYTIVKWDTVDGQVVAAAAATDALVGVTAASITSVSGARIDVIRAGLAQVKLNGTVARGDPITSDASGLGVKAAPAAGVNNQVIGEAEVSGVAGDVIPVMVYRSTLQG